MNTKTLSTEVLVFLVTLRKYQQRVALARKMSGEPPHLWNGYRSVVKGEETFERAAARTLAEQAGIHIEQARLQRFAVAEYGVGKDRPFRITHVFLCRHWNGKPQKTTDMGHPSWFLFEEIPTKEVAPGTDILLQRILIGEKLRIKFVLNDKQAVVDYYHDETVSNL